MKRVDLVRTIEGTGWVLVRHGGNHDRDRNPMTGVAQPVPRHGDVGERRARRIIRILDNQEEEPGST